MTGVKFDHVNEKVDLSIAPVAELVQNLYLVSKP